MIQPNELKSDLPMEVANGTLSTTTKVWETLIASYEGDLQKIKELVSECPDLMYAQYNYTPPIHFAVREGHTDIVKFLLGNGAHDPGYRFYPFKESLQAVANDRGYIEIEILLNEYAADTSKHKYKGDNGRIFYKRTPLQKAFENSVDENDIEKTTQLLKDYPEFALDETYFWGEGILTMPVKNGHFKMAELLMSHGAKVPGLLKWTQFYYFETYEHAKFIMQKGMSPNTLSWQHVTVLHDMAQKGFIDKTELLIKYGAGLDPVDEAYQSTPLGLAARWGQTEMVEYLLKQGADPNKAGASWALPIAWAKKKGHIEIENILRKAAAK